MDTGPQLSNQVVKNNTNMVSQSLGETDYKKTEISSIDCVNFQISLSHHGLSSAYSVVHALPSQGFYNRVTVLAVN